MDLENHQQHNIQNLILEKLQFYPSPHIQYPITFFLCLVCTLKSVQLYEVFLVDSLPDKNHKTSHIKYNTLDKQHQEIGQAVPEPPA